MKTLLLAMSALLVAAAPAFSWAQEDHHGQGGARPPGAGAARSAGPPPARPAGPPPAASQFRAPPQGGGFRASPGAPFAAGGYRPQGYAAGQPNGGYRGGYPGAVAHAGGQAFGFGGRQYFRYRSAPYAFPGGYGGWANHAWRRGEWLPPVFITSSYFIADWYDFGLWQPDYGYQWIRVGADAVLVSLADGQVVDVVPGVYYY